MAVLPFENRSRLEDDAYFVDGLHDDILTQLTRIGGLKVISRTSVGQFRDSRLTTREIAARLGVSHILEGGVQRAGERVRVTVQLVDAVTDAHLWAESYDRELDADSIFSIQSEVATAVAAALRTTLTPAEQGRVKAVPTRNLEAWEAYQAGRKAMGTRTQAELAADLLRRAEAWVVTTPRLGQSGHGITDARIRMLRGQPRDALARLREAQRAGWRGPYWRYYRDIDPVLAPIRDDPEFQAVFAEIERDMNRQRAELSAARDAGPTRPAGHTAHPVDAPPARQ